MHIMQMALLMARPEELAPTWRGPGEAFMQNLLGFPEGRLGLLLLCIRIFGFAMGSLGSTVDCYQTPPPFFLFFNME